MPSYDPLTPTSLISETFWYCTADVVPGEEGRKLGLRKLYRFGDLSFFDCAGVRLLK